MRIALVFFAACSFKTITAKTPPEVIPPGQEGPVITSVIGDAVDGTIANGLILEGTKLLGASSVTLRGVALTISSATDTRVAVLLPDVAPGMAAITLATPAGLAQIDVQLNKGEKGPRGPTNGDAARVKTLLATPACTPGSFVNGVAPNGTFVCVAPLSGVRTITAGAGLAVDYAGGQATVGLTGQFPAFSIATAFSPHIKIASVDMGQRSISPAATMGPGLTVGAGLTMGPTGVVLTPAVAASGTYTINATAIDFVATHALVDGVALAVTGAVDLGQARVRLPVYQRTASTSTDSVAALCFPGDVLIAGACDGNPGILVQAYPITAASFFCKFDQAGTNVARATCLRSY